MQRVVRSTFAGLLILAGLTACGDKVTVPGITTTTPPNVVHSVTVTPDRATLNQAVAGIAADKITLAVSVDADAGVTDRTVTWTSANSAIASVDQAGVVTAGTTAGTTTITAASKIAPDVKGASLITVVASGGTGTLPTISVSTINQTVCVVGGACTSVPANLGSVTGQIDVTLNVDPGSQKLAGVDLIMNCAGPGNSATDTVVATQNLVTANQIPAGASAALAPVTLSFNTASFNATTGAVAFRNGACTIKARARTTTGTTTSTVTQTLTLANTDVVVGTVTASNNKVNPVTGQVWSGGTVTVVATPILYTPNRAVRQVTLSFAGKTAAALGTTTSGSLAGAQTAVFVDGNGATVAAPNTDIDNITNAAAAATFAAIDTLGGAIVNTVAGANTCAANALCTQTSVLAGATAAVPTVRLDTQKPPRGSLAIANNALQNTGPSGYIGPTFRIVADSAAGFTGPNAGSAIGGGACLGNNGVNNPVTCNLDNNGVDSVTVVFFSNATGSRTAGSGTLITSVANLNETPTGNTNNLNMITTDLLGNADTTFAGPGNVVGASGFGVDKTPPTLGTITGPADQAQAQAVGGAGSYTVPNSDALSGTSRALVAQVIQRTAVTSANLPSATTVPNNTTFSNTGIAGTQTAGGANSIATGCVIGRFNRNAAAANAAANALPVFDPTGAQIGTCSPAAFDLTGGTTVSANLSGVEAYAKTIIIIDDQAANSVTALTRTVAEDATNPTAGQIQGPTTIAQGGGPITFTAAATDNLDAVNGTLQLNYPTPVMLLQYPTVTGPGIGFDNVLTTTGNIAPVATVFIRNLANAPAQGSATRPTSATAANAPSTITVGTLDEVNRVGTAGPTAITTFSAITQPTNTTTANPFAAEFTNGFFISGASTATVSDCPTAGCAGGAAPANPTTVTLTATASGTSGIFNNPFATVQFWYQVNGAGAWFLAGTASGASSRDTGATGFRFWDYTLTGFTPPKSSPIDISTGTSTVLTGGANLTFRAIGITGTGDGLVSNSQPVTLTNP